MFIRNILFIYVFIYFQWLCIIYCVTFSLCHMLLSNRCVEIILSWVLCAPLKREALIDAIFFYVYSLFS